MPEKSAGDSLRNAERSRPTHPPSTVDVTTDRVSLATTVSHDPALPSGQPAGFLAIPGYEILEEIAKGGMGRVFAARDLTLDREVAIKTLLPGMDGSRFLTESKITARLPHPGIPPVYALGALDDGTPYLAMKLIRGQTLAALLEGRPSVPEGLPRFVQIFEQIAQAVGFAHAQGIVHRDLKPLNVMVGAFGEVQVMDWGLAKDITNSGDAPPESPAETADNHDPHTMMGAVLGTPGYLAPEQARAEAVDARADVFALGSILAAILTGKAAITGTNRREMIEQAARAELADVHERLSTCGADAELVSLATRCLSARPEERPADALQVATEVAAYRAGVEARLRRAETERAEALVREAEASKRKRTIIAASGIVAAVLLLALGVSLWLLNRTLQARKNEVRANDQAFMALVTSMDEVVEEQMARAPRLTEANKKFLLNIIQQFDAFANNNGNDPNSRAIRAEARLRVGMVRYRLGDLPEAETAYREALDIYQQLVALEPARFEFREGLAECHDNLGTLLRATGRRQLSETSYGAAEKTLQQMATDFPGRSEVGRNLAKTHNNLGVLFMELGRTEEAEAALGQALHYQEQQVLQSPNRAGYRHELAAGHHNLGIVLKDRGSLQKAESELRAALDLRLKLVAELADRPALRRELSQTQLSLGELLSATGRGEDAETFCKEALVNLKQLTADFPTQPEYFQELAGAQFQYSLLLRDSGRLEKSEEVHRQGLAILKQLASDYPTRPEYRAALASSQFTLGHVMWATARTEEAEKAYTDSLAIFKKLVADYPDRPEFRDELAKCHLSLGNMQSSRGRQQEGTASLDAALELYRQLVTKFPLHPEHRQHLGMTLLNRGLVRAAAKQHQEAEADYREALTIHEQLVSEFPDRSEFRRQLAGNFNNLGALLKDTNRRSESEQAYNSALAILKQLTKELPENPNLHNEFAGCGGNLAAARYWRGDFKGAKKLLAEVREHHALALAVNPQDPTYRTYYRTYLWYSVRVHCALSEPAEAVRSAELRRDVGWNAADDASDAAGYLAQCIPLVASRKKLTDDQKREAAQFYGDEAMKMLREAVDRGFNNAANLKSTTALDPLRERTDFQELVAKLE